MNKSTKRPILEQLKKEKVWVAWNKVKFDSHKGKKCDEAHPDEPSCKMPLIGKDKKYYDGAELLTYQEALDLKYEGVGIKCIGGNIAAFDMDDCIKNGTIHPKAQEIIDKISSYAEISPSGNGVRIIAAGTIPGDRNRTRKTPWGGSLELYDENTPQYVTFTENTLNGHDVGGEQEGIDWVYDTYLKPLETVIDGKLDGLDGLDGLLRHRGVVGDDIIVAKIRKSKSGKKFDSLAAGGPCGYDSESEADWAMAGIIRFWTQDATQIENIMRSTGRRRKKWDTKRGNVTWIQDQIRKVVNSGGNTYDWDKVKTEDEKPIEDVDGKTLLTELVHEIEEYMDMDRDAAITTALWIIYSYLHGYIEFDVSTLLNIVSPVKQCGKTTLMGIIEAMVKNSKQASNLSAAALYFIVEKQRPVLLIDEADTILENNEELRTMINASYTRGSAKVLRVPEGKPREYDTWCPKVIAMIGNPPDTIQDRSITINLKRTTMKTLKRWRRKYISKYETTRNKIESWVINNRQEIERVYDILEPTEDLKSREADNWLPLLSIAKVIDQSLVEKIEKMAVRLRVDEDESTEIKVLRDIKNIFESILPETQLSVSELKDALNSLTESPWGNYNRGKGITSQWIWHRIKDFGICKSHRISGTRRGWDRMDFEDSWKRYI